MARGMAIVGLRKLKRIAYLKWTRLLVAGEPPATFLHLVPQFENAIERCFGRPAEATQANRCGHLCGRTVRLTKRSSPSWEIESCLPGMSSWSP
jgi:hypothetical protein